jgi:hypothetical protein
MSLADPQQLRRLRAAQSARAITLQPFERGEITLEAAAQIMDVSVMTALRIVRRGIINGRQLCRGAPWVIKVEDMAAYREQKPSRRSLTSDPSQQSFMFQ